MKQEILDRINELGGNINNVKNCSLQEDLLSISFITVLYPRPIDTPWSIGDETEPIYGIGEFIANNKELFHSDKEIFYNKLVDNFFQITEEGYGQMFYMAKLFTPYKEGTVDFEEWNDIFTNDVNLEEIHKIVNDPKPDFIQLFYSYGFPDHYYICLSDPNPENPTLFGTDHEQFFNEVTNEGNLEDFLKNFMTKDEVVEIVKKRIERQ
jgi:hypothetical protein